MDGTTVLWLILAAVAVGVLLWLGYTGMRRVDERKLEDHRQEAYNHEAQNHLNELKVQKQEAAADEVEARARRAQAEADEKAAEARRLQAGAQERQAAAEQERDSLADHHGWRRIRRERHHTR